jgi:hypothetical protein
MRRTGVLELQPPGYPMTTLFDDAYQRAMDGEDIDTIVSSLTSLTPSGRWHLKLRLQQYQNEDFLWRDRGLPEVSSLSTRCLRALVRNRGQSEEWLDTIHRLSREGAPRLGPALKAELGRLYDTIQFRIERGTGSENADLGDKESS